MAATFESPEGHCRELIRTLQSTNLHYFVQETPFSLYVTVRKKFVKNFVIQGSGRTYPAPHLAVGATDAIKRVFDAQKRQKDLECEEKMPWKPMKLSKLTLKPN